MFGHNIDELNEGNLYITYAPSNFMAIRDKDCEDLRWMELVHGEW
jgi:hypothetical protein